MAGCATRSIRPRSIRWSRAWPRNSAASTSWSTRSAAARSSHARAATVDELTLEEWKKIIDFNLDGTFLFTHAVVPVMKRQQGGKIVNLASIAGRGRSASSSSAYAAAKGGIIAFTKKLSYEVGPYGVNINAIAPSTTLTERIRPHWERRSQEDQARAIDATPLRRVAEAVDQARVICFLGIAGRRFHHRRHHRRHRRELTRTAAVARPHFTR